MSILWSDVQQFLPHNIQAAIRAVFDNNVATLPTSGAPTNGTSGTYAKSTGQGPFGMGPGSSIVDIVGTNGVYEYLNTNTAASPTWQSVLGPAVGVYTRVAITSANISVGANSEQ